MKRRVVDTVRGITREVEMSPAEAAAFEATRNKPRPRPENTPTQIGDIERALMAKGALTAADIANAKRNR